MRTTVAVLVVLALLGPGCSEMPEESTAPIPGSTTERLQRSIVVDGADLEVTLEVTIEGSGRSCIVIGSAVYYPRAFSDAFKQQFRCAYVSTRMFTAEGSKTIAPEEYTLDVVVSDLERVRDGLGLDRVVVIGHSMHALMALEYAKAHPERVSHVVMIGMSPRYDADALQQSGKYWETDASAERKSILARNMAELTDAVLGEASPEEVVALEYVARAPMYWFDPEYDASWLWADVPFDTELMGPILEGLGEYDVRRGLSDLKPPVLVIVGRYDYVVPHFLWDGVKDAFPNLTYHLFEESGHTPQLEQPELFDRTLLDWIAAN